MKTFTLLFSAATVLALNAGQPVAPKVARQVRQPAKSTRVVLVPKECRLQFVQNATFASGQPGILKFVKYKEGMKVAVAESGPDKGKAVVAGLVDRVARAQLAIAEKEAGSKIDILYAVKATEVAKVEYEKAEAANRELKGTVAEVDVLQLKLAYERAKLQIDLAKEKVDIKIKTRDLRRAELKAHEIEATFSGVVTHVFKHAGEAVSQGDPILEIVNPNLIRAEANVPYKDVLSIRKGDAVEVALLGVAQGRVLKGKIVFIDLRTQLSTKSVRVWAELKVADGQIHTGLQGQMKIWASGTSAK